MANNDEEDDYMSDKWLAKTDDVKPGLIYSHSAKVKVANELKHKQHCPKKKTVLEAERREEGLSTSLTSDNKGFQMMMKMGFKPGSCLGKTGSGIAEPISVDVKVDKTGLGKKRKLPKTNPEETEREKQQKLESFKTELRDKRDERQIESDLYKSQKVCVELDTRLDLDEPIENFFWPQKPDLTKEEGDDEEEGDDDEEEDEEEEVDQIPNWKKLESLTEYLRTTHLYCIWCGTTFDDGEDIEVNCPGNTFGDH